MSEDFVIDDSNFSEYFRDVKKSGPKPGDVMARYIARADLVGGEDKSYLIDVLSGNPMGAEMGVQLARNLFGAKEEDAVKLCKEIVLDLLGGMSREEVMRKPHPFTLEKFYWTREECVPEGDPHWQAIKVSFLIDPEKNEEEE